MKLFESELKILDILWEKGSVTAKKLAEILAEQTGWSKTTTYTVIKKCIDKGAVGREEPDFLCHALISRERAQETETALLIDKMFGGMPDQLVASVLGQKKLSRKEIERLKSLIQKLS
jgi:predicted transcriptional regulator